MKKTMRQLPGKADFPSEYPAFLKEIKTRIRTAQVRASFAANTELLRLYWDIGRCIVEKQERERWGSGIIDRLAFDLRREFPGIEGFSRTNIYRMRAFCLAWPDTRERIPKGSPRRSVGKKLTTVHETGIVPQPVGQLSPPFIPQSVGQIPWGHNVLLIEKLSAPDERLWYARKTVEHGWSRPILQIQIESGLFHRQGKAVTNFERALPPPQSDLARQALKDPYVFDFLTLRGDANERELERNLMAHVEKFLLELGAGFSLVGRQVHLEVGGDDFYIDLLFYHLKLRCYVVIDLKARAFVPEYAGKMNFYLSAVDDRLRRPGDRPSMGLILCKAKNRVVAEYALRDIRKPVGISGYVTRLVESLPKPLQDSIPSIAEIERELSKSCGTKPFRKAKGKK